MIRLPIVYSRIITRYNVHLPQHTRPTPTSKGDIINLDITCYVNGYHGDCSEMFVVGGEDAANESTKNLLQTTYDCWLQALNFVQLGNDYKDIGAIIEDYVTERVFSTVQSQHIALSQQ